LFRSNPPDSDGAAPLPGRLRPRAWACLAAVAALGLSGLMTAASASAQQTPAAATAHQHVTGQLHPVAGHDYAAACATATAGHMACMALVRTSATARPLTAAAEPDAIPAGVGYGPSQLESAYALPSSTAGSGQTVAIVDAFNDPNAASDLATYRSAAGLPACGAGCFSVVNQNGQASPLPGSAGTTGWDVEESLDIDMVSAICPLCHILLVEANSATTQNLGTAVNAAVNLGAKYVSNSYGGSESSADPSTDNSFYNHPGVAVTASAGDSGFGVEYPAASQFVTAVGGTSLTTASSARGWNETVWNGTGSGCSADDAKPGWQQDTGCARRTVADVAAVANPNTGVAVFDTFSQGGWLEVGGTSASSPIIASVFALAGTPAAGTYPSSYPYSHTSNLFDVTSGSNGSCSPAYLCTAQAGYDGPTGLGTPDGTAAFTSGGGGNTVTVTSPGNQTGTVGTAASVQIHATDSSAGQTLTYSATGLPAGLSISSSGLISGTPATAATSSVTVTATDATGAHGSASFTWTINPASTGGGSCHVVYTTNSQWPGGFTAQVVITNTGAAAISSWSLTWTYPGDQKVTSDFNGPAPSQSGETVTLTNASYNGSIAPSGSVTVGFQGTWTNSDAVPTSFTLNGSTCG
jgi:subtilase family serine protease